MEKINDLEELLILKVLMKKKDEIILDHKFKSNRINISKKRYFFEIFTKYNKRFSNPISKNPMVRNFSNFLLTFSDK